MTRREIEEQAALAAYLNTLPEKRCILCNAALNGLEKIGQVCVHCISDRAARGEPAMLKEPGGLQQQLEQATNLVRRYGPFYRAMEALTFPSGSDREFAHEFWHIKLDSPKPMKFEEAE